MKIVKKTKLVSIDDVISFLKILNEKYGSFRAPELLTSNVYNEKTDVWSFGMLMMSVLIGDNFYVENKQYQFYWL